MGKTIYIFSSILASSLLLYAIAELSSREPGFRDRLIRYIEENQPPPVAGKFRSSPMVIIDPPDREGGSVLEFEKGDWEHYITGSRYGSDYSKRGSRLYEDDKMNISSYGSLKADLVYGDSVFTSKKYRRSDTDQPTSKVISTGFTPKQEVQLHLEGNVGRRMSIYIDHDSRREDNRYRMNYRAVNDDEIIREINAGEVDISFKNSKYAVYDNTTAKGLGVDVTVKKNNFQIKAFGSVTRGETVVENFRGTASPGSMKLSEYQYIRLMYYQLEPFLRYDGSVVVPSDSSIYALNTFKSDSSDFTPFTVDLDPSGFAVYLDDQVGSNNTGTIQLSFDNGYYAKLSGGVDYTINYATGVIRFLKGISESSRVFVVYNLKSGSSNDPGVTTNAAFSGYNFVFIKYGPSLNEDIDGDYITDGDTNNDGVLNSDIYEIRSFYSLGTKNIMPSKFSLQFYEENSILDTTARGQAGNYQIDYENGIVFFNYREPFRSLLGDDDADVIYSEKQLTSAYTSSRYALGADFYREARSFKLKYFNLIPGSLRVKVNNREVTKSLYTVDYTSGYLTFSDPNNPLITPETAIEIRYEYIPLGGQAQSFVGGVRADYQVHKSLNVGGTLLYTRSGGTEVIPVLSQAPSDTLLMEGDANLHLTPAGMADVVNTVAGSSYKTMPLEFKFYGEYARSMRNMNTFGKGLIDNMESTDEIVAVSLSEKDWILSSPPDSYDQSTRGKLLYYYYRDANNPGVLKTTSFTPTAIDYATKPGPFNVATGHVDSSISKESAQQSLAFDFDFTGGNNYVSIATRHLSNGVVDFSGLQYVEISWRYTGAASTDDEVDLRIDLGTINEDSDGDSILDTEDANGNGELDTDPDSGISEDVGYAFNGNNATVEGSGTGLATGLTGDGYLSTEDLNGNGILDTSENVVTISKAAFFEADDSEWHESRIYFDSTADDVEKLKQVQSIRLALLQGTQGDSGRIYIDRIRFVSSRWRDPRIFSDPSGSPWSTANSSQLKVTVINSLNDSDYRTDAFHLNQKDVYTDLYGSKSSTELQKESESALKLEYDTSGSRYTSIERRFAEAMDLRFYKTLHLWINSRSFGTDDKLGITIGSSDSDYRVYWYTLTALDTWQDITMKLQGGSSGSLDVSEESGTVDMKRINYIKLSIDGEGDAGELWINDIYVSDAETLTSDASWIESELNFTRPLFRTKGGTPILSDIRLKYIRKGHGANFSSIGKTITDISEHFDQVFTSFKITPKWKTSFDFVREVSSTDSLNADVAENQRGDTNKKTFNLESAYESSHNAVPSIKLAYKSELYNNELNEEISGGDVLRSTAQVNHAPVLVVDEKIDNFLWGKLTARLVMNLLFTQEKINRESDDFTEAVLSGITSVKEEEKRQKSDTSFFLEYRNSFFYLRPAITASSEEIVAFQGKGDSNEAMIFSDFSGDFHFPYAYNDDMRFIERNKKFQFDLGFHGIKYLNPVYSMELSYLENGFRDYDDTELAKTSLFTRAKDARSYISTKIALPVNLKSFKKIKGLSFVKSLSASYSRSLFLTETGVPFENEGEGEFSEQYGISRAMGNLANAGLNIFQFFPGFSFIGRNNYARGRDYVYKQMNSGLAYEGGETAAAYNNNLKLLENMGVSWLFDFKKFTFSSGLKLSQISERQSVSGIPQQVISRDLSFQFRFDLMKLFRFGFFRLNEKGKPHHAASCNIGYVFSNSMIITSNIREDKHAPKFGMNFKWGRSHAGVTFGVDIRHQREAEYIELGSGRDPADDIYFNNLTTVSGLNEFSTAYSFALIYETDVVWLFNLFSKLHRLVSFPIMTLEYKLALNRYDYSITTAPEAYDMHLFSGKITLDMHKNVQGSLSSRLVLEQYRNRDSGSVNREIFSYEVAAQFSLIF